MNKLLLICCLLAMVSCKSKKQILASRKPADSAVVNHAESKLDLIKATQANFNTFSGKARTKLDINGSSNDVTLNIRINKGKKIWVSITAIAGIEAARALITPDSIFIINRLQGLYVKKPFRYIYNYASRELDYGALEALLVGNAIPQLLNDEAKLQTDSLTTTLSGSLDELVYHLIIGPDMKVTQTNMSDQNREMSLTVNNNQFIQAGNRVMPSQIDIESMAKTKKIQASIHYTKVDFDLPLEYPFSIPSRYDAAN